MHCICTTASDEYQHITYSEAISMFKSSNILLFFMGFILNLFQNIDLRKVSDQNQTLITDS